MSNCSLAVPMQIQKYLIAMKLLSEFEKDGKSGSRKVSVRITQKLSVFPSLGLVLTCAYGEGYLKELGEKIRRKAKIV